MSTLEYTLITVALMLLINLLPLMAYLIVTRVARYTFIN